MGRGWALRFPHPGLLCGSRADRPRGAFIYTEPGSLTRARCAWAPWPWPGDCRLSSGTARVQGSAATAGPGRPALALHQVRRWSRHGALVRPGACAGGGLAEAPAGLGGARAVEGLGPGVLASSRTGTLCTTLNTPVCGPRVQAVGTGGATRHHVGVCYQTNVLRT